MKQYEYKCVFIWGTGEPTTRRLNEFGREGCPIHYWIGGPENRSLIVLMHGATGNLNR